MRILAAAFLLAATIILSTAAARAEARTVRIEPRPFYGATVTLEEGVRVFRPLPPHDRVIINPGSKTPLSLGIRTATMPTTTTTTMRASARFPTSAAAASASSPAESTFVVMAPGTTGAFARCAARSPEQGRLSQRPIRTLVGWRGKG